MFKKLQPLTVNRSFLLLGIDPVGLILDSSILITAERKGLSAREALSEIAERVTGEDIALSVITLIELMHGAVRSNSPARSALRRQFLDELAAALPIHPVTVAIAMKAGQISGDNMAKGINLGLGDLLIGVTALELNYSVATGNVRHFQMVPGLEIVTF